MFLESVLSSMHLIIDLVSELFSSLSPHYDLVCIFCPIHSYTDDSTLQRGLKLLHEVFHGTLPDFFILIKLGQ